MSADTELRGPASQERADEPGSPADGAPRSSRRRDAAIVIVALLVGMGAVAGYGALTNPDEGGDAAIIEGDLDGDFEPAPDPLAGRDVAAGTPAGSATEAVEQFLTAEAEGDFSTSYSLLTGAQRAEYGSAAAWTNAHANFLPITGYEIVGAVDDRIATMVEYRSDLDEVVGLVPARGRVEWVAVQEDGGWLVDFDAASLEPLYLDDALAPEAVAEWARTLQECGEPTQYEGALVATADLVRAAESLCDQAGRITTGDAVALDEFDGTALVSAFGADALAWARAVELGGPVELTVVVAPVGDRWLVTGLLPAG